MEVKIKIVTKQYDENSNMDKIEVDTTGELYTKNDDTYVVYKITEEGRTTTSTLKISKDEISIKQFGDSNSTMILKEGKNGVTKYRTPQGLFIIETDTTELKIDKSKENCIKIKVKYNIKIMEIFQGRNEISILIQNKE